MDAFEQLRTLSRPAATVSDAARQLQSQRGSWAAAGGARGAARRTPTPQGRAGARALRASLDPLTAAVALGAVLKPRRLDDHIEALEEGGFGDPALQPLARELIALRMRFDSLDTDGVGRHLAGSGYSTLLDELSKAAARSGAPFLAGEGPAADLQWAQAFEAITRMAALEAAVSNAKAVATEGLDPEAFRRLKAERDALKRALKSGTLWTDGVSFP